MAAGSKTIKAGEAFLELSVRDANFRRSLDRSITRLRSLGAAFKSVGSLGIAGGGIAGLQRALALIAGSAALTWPVKLAADLEVAQAAFTALTGSADKARSILAELQVFAGASSFSFDTLQGAARNMLNFGVTAEQVIPLVQQLGAIAAGDADRLDRLAIAFGQTQAKGRLMAEEVRQMVNAGFNPLQEIARTTGRSMKELLRDMEAGNVTAAQTAAAFESVVAPGGRFNGILELISNTAIGQFNKLKAGIKIAVIPLGNELLPAITGVLRKINELIPSFAGIIQANASWARVIAVTVLSVSGLLAALFSFGIAFQVIAFSGAGLLGALSALTSPIVLVGAALAGLAVIFVKFTNLGQAAFGFLADKFGELGKVARETFEGISDALAGGSLPAAANVLWAGLQLAWLQGTSELTSLWIEFKDVFLRTTLEMLFSAQKFWATFVNAVKSIWSSLVTESKTIGEKIGHALTRSRDDPELAADQDREHNAALARIAAEGQADQRRIDDQERAALQSIDDIARAAAEDRHRNVNAEIAAAKKAQQEAQRAFDEAREKARERRPKGEKFEKDFQAALLGDIGGGAGGLGPRSTFSGKLSPQVFAAAGQDKIPRAQLDELKKANAKLDKIERKKQGGMVVGAG